MSLDGWYMFIHLMHFQIIKLLFDTLQDIGAGKGKYYAVNFPLRDGIDDDAYETIFKPVSF